MYYIYIYICFLRINSRLPWHADIVHRYRYPCRRHRRRNIDFNENDTHLERFGEIITLGKYQVPRIKKAFTLSKTKSEMFDHRLRVITRLVR